MVTKIHGQRRQHLYIVEHMKDKELGDAIVANRIGVARETVTRWRKQQHRLNPEKIAILAAALNMRPEDLWRPPSARPSLDAMLQGKPDDLQDTATDIVRRLIGK